MKNEKMIKEKIEELKKNFNSETENQIKILEWVLNDYEPVKGIYYIFSDTCCGDQDEDIIVGTEKAKNYFFCIKHEGYVVESWLYPAVTRVDTGAMYPDYNNPIDHFVK